MKRVITPNRSSRPLRRSVPFASMTWADWVLLLLLAGFFCFLCVVRSRARLLWADELLGDRVLNSPSLAGTLRGWWEGADGGGLLYCLLARPWMMLFHHTALGLRMFSAVGMATGVALTWIAARQYFSTVSVAWASAVVYLCSGAPRWQIVNGRFYGLFFASAALASLCFLLTADREPTRSDLVWTAVAHGLLIGSHTLGLVYSFSLIVGMVVLDRGRGRTRWRLYASAAAGWVVLAASLHSIDRSTSIAKGVFWTRKPGPHEFLLGLTDFSNMILLPVVALVLVSLAKLALRREFTGAVRRMRSSAPAFLCGSLVLAQAILFLKSRVGLSVYADRYLLPLTIVTTFGLAACLDWLFALPAFSRRHEWLGFAAALLLLLPACVFALGRREFEDLYPKPGLPERIAADLPRGASVLVTLLPDFTLLSKYDPSRRYFFLLDWPFDLRPARAGGDYSGQREMENWRRAGYLKDGILDCPDVFRKNSELYILLDPGRQDWIADRLQHNPGYVAERLLRSEEWEPYTLWRVHRVGNAPPPC